MNYPKIVKIKNIKSENDEVKTFTFNYPGDVQPGQFYMIWIPKIDEIPMSVSYISEEVKGFTFRKVGDATKALFNMEPKDKIGVRGPFGKGFDITGEHILFVGGGTGIAMLAPAIEIASSKKIKSNVILGVKNKKELFFKKRIKKLDVNVLISTDDGSEGHKGYATDLVKEILEKKDISNILTCGPEIMMKKIYELSGKIHMQASLERYMKCGCGICGQCCVGEGLRVCKDGPIFTGEELKNIEDFGKYKRDAAGRKIKI